MPLFVLQCTDHDNVLEKRLSARPAHLARIEVLNAEGRLIAAGPMPKNADDLSQGFYGSVIIAEFESREAVDTWVADEPYLHAGVYQSVDIKPFLKVFPKAE